MRNDSLSGGRRAKRPGRLSRLAPALLLLCSGLSHGWELEGALGVGYDGNPSRTPDGAGYGFARLRTLAQQS